MSVRSVLGGRLSSTTASSLMFTPPLRHSSFNIVHPQLARLHSTSLRPFQHPAPKQALRSSVRSSQSSSLRSTGLRSQSTTSAGKDEIKLDWNSFFKLRASRRRYSLASSIVTSLLSTTAGVQVLSNQDLESLGAQVMGLDPFVVLGLATAACGAVGWLAGPMVGNGVWGLVYRKFRPSVATVSDKATGLGIRISPSNCHFIAERERVLRSHSTISRRSIYQLHLQPGS